MADSTTQISENKAAWILAEGGKIEVGPADLWEPEKGQIRVRVRFPNSLLFTKSPPNHLSGNPF